MSSIERVRTKRVRESITEETKLMQLPKDKRIKLPKLKSNRTSTK